MTHHHITSAPAAPEPSGPTTRPVLAGLTDEAAASLDGQLAAVRTLGWTAVELRSVDGTPLADLPRDEVRTMARRLAEAGVHVVCLASRIGNWARPITSDFALDIGELRVLEEYAQLLDCRRIRVMSYPNDGLPEVEWGRRSVERLHHLTERAETAGLTLLHENCAGWAGADAERALHLLEEVDSPALRLLFDIGNGVPYGYRAVELLRPLLPYVHHVHVKDAVRDVKGRIAYTLPGDGEAEVRTCLRLLAEAAYGGAYSIEPHLAVRPHEGLARAGEDAADLFVRAGRRLAEILGAPTGDGSGGGTPRGEGRTSGTQPGAASAGGAATGGGLGGGIP
ncbi:sugar phosphate isomerase/epimerase family protein [Streptomyces sp. NPDC052042]|uniref:sugar phosphate isomerase/epimerase family protein n=1 Tax=Streptomyces sp. NPDC052042 TaxID=3365683 RepID=UPI0037CE8562